MSSTVLSAPAAGAAGGWARAGARPQTEAYAPAMDARRREAAYARWLDAVARVRS